MSKHAYITVSAAKARWGLSRSCIVEMCKAGRIPGAVTAETANTHLWLIPKSAPRPEAKRAGRPRALSQS